MPNAPKRRWYRLSPDRFMAGLILIVCVLWLSERFGWFGFDDHKGWPVLAALAAVAAWAVVAVFGCIAGLIFRRRVQFSVRSLLLFVLAASIAFGWLKAEMRSAVRQAATIRDLEKSGWRVSYTWEFGDDATFTPAKISPAVEWLENQLGQDFFGAVKCIEPGGELDPEDTGDLTGIRRVALSNDDRADAILQHLRSADELNELDLDGSKVADDGLKQLGRFPALEKIDLSYTRITDGDAQYLGGLRSLRKIDLASTNITDAGLRFLVGLRSLTSLNLFETDVGDAGLRSLQHCLHLRQLNLGKTCISDDGLKYVGSLSQLRYLSLDNTKITDAGLERLQNLHHLEFLSLVHTRATDACIASLIKITRLTTLAIPSAGFTGSGLKSLHESLPACEVLLAE